MPVFRWEELKVMPQNDFSHSFATVEQCLEFLAAEKWKDGFVCRKCGHTHYCKGKTPFSRRCTRCKSEESATAHTIFHRCKIHLPEAFSILRTACTEPDLTANALSERLDLRLMTCWRFRKKVMECLSEKNGNPILQPATLHTKRARSKE